MKASLKVALALVFGSLPAGALAQQPAENVSPVIHTNLAAAQDLVGRAYERVAAAQQANEFDLGGHAERAKELLRQANEELKLAALTANEE